METITDQQIQERFAQLPQDVQLAIKSNKVEEHLQKIGSTYGLHIDQLGELKNATYLVMLGFADPAQFVGDIVQFVRVSKEQAEKIAEEVSTELFLPIRESLQKFTQSRAPKAPPAVPKPQTISPVEEKPMELKPITDIDHMLTAPTVAPAQKIPVLTSANLQKKNVDPYREPTSP